jgi:hypothetical protein
MVEQRAAGHLGVLDTIEEQAAVGGHASQTWRVTMAIKAEGVIARRPHQMQGER